MQYRKVIQLIFALIIVLNLSAALSAQQRKTKPTKYPQQLPNIIGDDNQPNSSPSHPDKADVTGTGVSLSPQQTDLLIRAIQNLSGEVRGMVQEMRALNTRQQAQLDILRMTRADMRIDQYERELKVTRDRLVQVTNDEQQLQFALKPESLEAQMRTVATLNREATMQQIKESYEAKLRAVQNEKELLQRREFEILGAIKGYQEAVGDTERRLQTIEDSLKQLDSATNPNNQNDGQSPSAKPE